MHVCPRSKMVDCHVQRYDGVNWIIVFGVFDELDYPMKFIRHSLEWQEDCGWLVAEYRSGGEHVATETWNTMTGLDLKVNTVFAKQWINSVEGEEW